MRIQFVKYLLLSIGLTVVQLTVIPFFEINSVTPDLVLILVVFFTLKTGQMYGSIFGFTAGFLLDLISGGLLGSAMFSKSLAGFVAGYFYNENKIEQSISSYNFIFIVLLAGIVDSFSCTILTTSLEQLSILFLFFNAGMMPAIYSAVFSFPIVFYYKWKGQDG